MVWSEKTSGDIVGEKGVMNTHDMETFNYFKGTQVHCALAPREMERFELTDYIQNEFATGLINVNYLHTIYSAAIDYFAHGCKKNYKHLCVAIVTVFWLA